MITAPASCKALDGRRIVQGSKAGEHAGCTRDLPAANAENILNGKDQTRKRGQHLPIGSRFVPTGLPAPSAPAASTCVKAFRWLPFSAMTSKKEETTARQVVSPRASALRVPANVTGAMRRRLVADPSIGNGHAGARTSTTASAPAWEQAAGQ